ncbi:hypothetical protein [Brevundimonas sp.]|uniref:hypothetical protein n=1 Tax=Brevundimonas sp. TaxID=1871086 RepID=UPI00391BC06F
MLFVEPVTGFAVRRTGGAAGQQGRQTGVCMRFSQPVRMSDDGDHSPVWARNKRRRGNPLVGFLVTLLALFGVLTAVLGVKERSLAEGGALMDGWINTAVSTVRGEAPKVADQAGDAAEAAASRAGDAAQAGAAAASEELKKQ